MHLHNLTIKKFHKGLLNKEFSALEMTQGFYNWIEKRDKEVGAYLSLNKDSAVKQAEAADIKIAKGEPAGALAGVPLAIKDNLLIEGLPATAGSKILKDYIASYDATVIKKLKSSGAVFLGTASISRIFDFLSMYSFEVSGKYTYLFTQSMRGSHSASPMRSRI